MTLLADFDIRFSEPGDLAFLEKCFSAGGASDDFPFGPAEMEEALKNWIGFSKYNASLTGTLQNIPCALGTLFLMPYKKVAHHCSFYIIVDPEHRRKGIGTDLIRNLLHLAKTRFRLESVHAELFEPSLLTPLLQKLNFIEFARQENYVHIDGCKRPRVLMEHFFS
jgi:putative acetyltransferase